MNIFGNKGTININGSSYSGSNVSIINGVVTVDGVVQKQQIGHVVNVTITGDVDRIENASGEVLVKGNVTGNVKTVSGDVNCGSVGNDVQTVSGNVTADGSIGGSVKTVSGNIKSRKAKEPVNPSYQNPPSEYPKPPAPPAPPPIRIVKHC